MTPPAADALAHTYARLAQHMVAAHPGVTHGSGQRGFGSTTLNHQGRMFAMLVAGRGLAVKLGPTRVQALADSGAGDALTMGSRTLRAWLLLHSHALADWQTWAHEALQHARFNLTPP